MSYKALLFDLDNTLLDFTHAETVSLASIYQHYFAEKIEFQTFKKQYHDFNRQVWGQVEIGALEPAQAGLERFNLLVQELKIALDHQQIATHYENGLIEHGYWYPGAKAALEQLKPKYQLGIITNGMANIQQKKYVSLELHQFCECYLISEVVGISKPNKIIFDMALEQLGIKAHEALMVGDSISSDYQGAINAGMDFCWINPEQQKLPKKLPKPKFNLSSVTELPTAL